MPTNSVNLATYKAVKASKAVGSATQPVYIASDGTITACTAYGSASVSAAGKWATARTFTIGNTGKSVDGSANVAWSKAEILGSSTDANFYRGDQTWSNTLNGTFTANGGYLKSTANGNTVTIGSQNSGFTHIYNSANISFIFNNSIATTNGNLGSTSYPWNNLYIGKSNGAGIYYTGTKATYRMIRFIDNTSDTYGNGISIGAGGQTIIGGGESADTAAAQVGTGGSEIMYVCNDGDVHVLTNLQSGWDSRKDFSFNTGGDFTAPRYLYCSYINESCGTEAPSTSSNWIFANSDGWLRKSTNVNIGVALKNQFLHYNGWWSSENGLSLDNANGMVFAYSNNGHPTDWGIVATFDCQLDSDYRLQLAGGGYDNTLWFRNRSSDRGGWYTGWQRVVTNSGTWSISITGSAASATYASSYLASRGSVSGASHAAALQSYFNSYKSSEPRNALVAHYSSAYGNGSMCFGYFLSGYDSTPYGGFFVANYNTAYYVGIQDGSYSQRKIWTQGDAVTSAVWNDYAEARESLCTEPGRAVQETGSDTLALVTKRLAPCAGIVSDTWGFSQGKTDKAKTHIAVAGRVLAYPYRNRDEYKPGDVLCAAPGGTVDIMTREEVIQYPDRIVGTVSCVPDYDEWGGGEGADRPPVKVNGRIWVRVH